MEVSIMPVVRSRGRPQGIPLDKKTCPHSWDQCFGPALFRKSGQNILDGLKSHQELAIMSGAIDSLLWTALGYLGLSKLANIEPASSPCPYGLDCSSPSRAAAILLQVEPLLIDAEIFIYNLHGESLSLGESPIYHLNVMLSVIGFQKEGHEMLEKIRIRRREFMVHGIVSKK